MALVDNKSGAAAVDPFDHNAVVDAVVLLQDGGIAGIPTLEQVLGEGADGGDVSVTGIDDLTLGGDIIGAVNVEIDGALNHDGTTIGFFGHAPHAKPVVPLTTPDAQDVIDALLLLGLIAQSD